MAIPQFVYNILEEQMTLVMNIDDPIIIEETKKIAFYAAMLDAALEDPMDDADDHAEMLEFLKKNITEHVETYQSLVNDKL